jgi:hypothetical protein
VVEAGGAIVAGYVEDHFYGLELNDHQREERQGQDFHLWILLIVELYEIIPSSKQRNYQLDLLWLNNKNCAS